MPVLDPLQDIDLDRFLTQIRLSGIVVGITELQRLQSVFSRIPVQSEFSRIPVLSRPQLCELFCALLGKNEGQRRTIRRIYEQLVPYDAFVKTSNQENQASARWQIDHFSADQQNEAINDSDSDHNKPTNPLNIFKFGAICLLIIGLLLPIISLRSPDPTPTLKKPETTNLTVENTQITKQVTKHTPKLQKTIKVWIPKISVKNHPLNHYLLAPVLLLFGGGLGFFWLLHQANLRTRIRQPKLPVISAKCQFYLPHIQNSQDYFLLNAGDRREMIRGIHHVLTDIPLTRLDMLRSVQETARSGLPSVHFLPATQLQEIWLWQDQDSANLDLLRLADEVTNILQHANLEVQRGYFHGFPNHVRDRQGSNIWSQQHPQPQNQPILIILLDIGSLNAMDALNQPHSHYLLQQFSDWNTLCLVDCSQQPGSLSQLVKPYTLDCVLPQQVSAWLARQGAVESSKQAMPEYRLDELHRWALACALPGRILMISEIRALHDAMQLDCAWQLSKLQQGYARPAGSGLEFSQQRHKHLREFTELMQTQPVVARLAVQFWLRRYAEIDNSLLQQQAVHKPWKDSPQQHAWHLETALLQLWLPEMLPQAAKQLHDLQCHKQLHKKVKQYLGQYKLLDWPIDQSEDQSKHKYGQWIILPYQANNLPADSLQQLIVAGMGGQTDHSLQLRCDRQTSLITGLFTGVSLIALIASAFALRSHAPEIISAGSEPTDTIQHLNADTLWVGTPKQLQKYPSIPDNSSVSIHWQSNIEQDNIIPIGDSQLWRAGTISYPPRPDNSKWPVLSVAVIAADPKQTTAQQLAIKLLDTVSADQVLIGKDWRNLLPHLSEKGLDLRASQWLYIFPYLQEVAIEYSDKVQNIAVISGDWKVLHKKLDIAGIQTLSSLKSDNSRIEIIRGAPVLNGVDNSNMITLRDGIILQRIPEGSFQMGDEDSRYDERSVHTVTFNRPFYMSQTEITFAQYDAYAELSGVDKPKDLDWGRRNQPVINVSWNDAQDYVQWLTQQTGYQCRLPSEAEWEYAARAGTTTNYFWGDAIGNNNANCRGCGSQWDYKQTAPVASFAANLWGMYDMHGNVWEWVQDCWDENYQEAPSDGNAWQKQCTNSERRVVRGGTWMSGPDLARSSNRNKHLPYYGFVTVGFRVVCSQRRSLTRVGG